MAKYDDNPFAGDSENPFADPFVASHTSNAARGIEDFNPFVDQNSSKPGSAAKVEEEHEHLRKRQEVCYRENNFPPLPSKCPLYVFALCYNCIAAMALLVSDTGGYAYGGQTFGFSILYLVLNVPLSFLCWYRPSYKALK
ncbi:Secretory carrier-associated membrane protein 2 [Acropora cervicornis]|uniref:Secretory carrier-associated membrane protein n=1 Tax=Acropora cervicornis TaxID=6130 RepID=A0AAD9UYK8_ACRCE|nr:Secretory carrier-associated membrane protein 2 [Acropora cervicornis]